MGGAYPGGVAHLLGLVAGHRLVHRPPAEQVVHRRRPIVTAGGPERGTLVSTIQPRAYVHTSGRTIIAVHAMKWQRFVYRWRTRSWGRGAGARVLTSPRRPRKPCNHRECGVSQVCDVKCCNGQMDRQGPATDPAPPGIASPNQPHTLRSPSPQVSAGQLHKPQFHAFRCGIRLHRCMCCGTSAGARTLGWRR